MKWIQFLQHKNHADVFRLNEKHNGILNRDKIMYLINESNHALGFFAMYRYWLEYLYFADICGYIPVIEGGEDSVYREKKPIGGTANVFEYYFEQPSSVSVSEVRHSSHVILSDIVQRQMVELILTGKRGHYYCNAQYNYLMSKMVYKYIKYNSRTQKYIDEGLDRLQFEKGKMLGVHIRGTDFKKKYNDHPVFVTEKDCFLAIEKILNKNNYDKIFVATDDQNILNAFIRNYGTKICYYRDVMRSNDMHSVIFHEDVRAHHRYKSGLEVIRDMHTLSCCKGLIAGISQVAICARINKLAKKERYENLVIIDKGIYNNQHHFCG